ncbi:hypothetical protein PIB30_076515 [Stylosanthes scabra]|uniref:Uncharacterized protein n=1 Tax=Stylosanthes scabra TaxID=79078 RepID=A0ABU6TR20_9FABA|nr:hypothetical protein [Stylosanthes scabra]
MGSKVIYYEYEAHKEYDDGDVEATTELGTIKIRRYHSNDEKFSHSVRSGRFDHDRPYEFLVAMLGGGGFAASGGTFNEFQPTPSATIAPPQMARIEPTLSLGPSVQTYPPCRRRIICVPARSSPAPRYSPLSRGHTQGDDAEMKESEEKEKSEPEEDPEEEEEKSKETSDTQSMGASTKSEFLRFMTSRQHLFFLWQLFVDQFTKPKSNFGIFFKHS